MSDNGHETPQDDVPAAALPAGDHAGDGRPRGRATGRDYGLTRRYSPIEKAGLTWLAIRDGVTATADAHDVPRSTLTTWLEEAGGIGPVQEWLRTETLQSFLKFEQALYAEVTHRLPSLPNDELALTVRKLIEARALVPAQAAAAQPDGQPALAAAQATVTLKIEEKDGEVSYIELGTPPEASDEG